MIKGSLRLPSRYKSNSTTHAQLGAGLGSLGVGRGSLSASTLRVFHLGITPVLGGTL